MMMVTCCWLVSVKMIVDIISVVIVLVMCQWVIIWMLRDTTIVDNQVCVYVVIPASLSPYHNSHIKYSNNCYALI